MKEGVLSGVGWGGLVGWDGWGDGWLGGWGDGGMWGWGGVGGVGGMGDGGWGDGGMRGAQMYAQAWWEANHPLLPTTPVHELGTPV